MDSPDSYQALLTAIDELYSEKVPFDKVLGIKVVSIGPESVMTSFQMRDELLGHCLNRMLHGGVISSAIDVTGGLSAVVSAARKEAGGRQLETIYEIAGRVRTLDLRVDFLNPGIGEHFLVKAHALRVGKKAGVIRMELKNDKQTLIAVGIGTYVIA